MTDLNRIDDPYFIELAIEQILKMNKKINRKQVTSYLELYRSMLRYGVKP